MTTPHQTEPGNALNDKVAAYCEAAIARRVFPGCALGWVTHGAVAVRAFGHLTYEAGAPAVTPDTVYDLASVTKSIPTSALIMSLADEGQLGLDDRVVQYLPELTNQHREALKIRHLLTFTAVFELGRTMASLARDDTADLLQVILTAPLQLPPGTAYQYTNAPSLLLGLVAERVTGRRLDDLARARLFEPLGMHSTTFDPIGLAASRPGTVVAPTALDWRGEVRGQVHDPGAWALSRDGHVPGHAGLFSTTPDLMRFVQMLLAKGTFEGRQYFRSATVRAMHTNQTPHLKSRTGLGWEIDRPEAHGTKVSDEAFGKTGFTGTSVLIDPARQAGMVLLCNRTYPETGERAEILRVWRDLADLVFG